MKALWQRLGTAIRLLNEGAEEPLPVAATMVKVIARCRKEDIATLAKSTRNTDGSMLKVHIVPKWGSSMSVPWPVVVAQVADDLTRFEGACPETTQAAHRQGDVGNDPRRQEPDDVGEGQGSVEETEEGRAANSGADGDVDRSAGGPYSTMVYVAASLGLRVEEVVALQWEDFDF